MVLIICNGSGILLIGNINPDKSIVGNINPIKEIIIAFCCVSEIVDINIPNASEVIINKILSAPSKNKLPWMGILNMNMLIRIITAALIIDKKMYGITLPIIT